VTSTHHDSRVGLIGTHRDNDAATRCCVFLSRLSLADDCLRCSCSPVPTAMTHLLSTIQRRQTWATDLLCAFAIAATLGFVNGPADSHVQMPQTCVLF
jgi:hypothetical protein